MTATEAQVDAAGKAMFYGSLGSGSTVLWDGMREETKAFWRDRGRYIADAVAAVSGDPGSVGATNFACSPTCRLIHEHRHCPGDCGCVTYPNATDERWPDAARWRVPRADEQVAARQELADAQHRKDRALLVALIRHVGGRVTLSTDEVAFADPDAIITAKPTDLGDFVTVDVASWVKQ